MSYYADLESHAKSMSKSQLENHFRPGTYRKEIKDKETGGTKWIDSPYYTKAYLMRSLIMNEKRFGNSRETRTLRGMWYQVIKPVLSRLEVLEDADSTEKGLSEWDKRLSKCMCDLLRKGELLFSDLGIYDSSRKRSTPSETFYNIGGGNTYTYKGAIAPYPEIIIVSEKDTVYSVLSRLSGILGTSCLSAKGQNSLGAMEGLVKGIVYHDKFKDYLRNRKTGDERPVIRILPMTDYDPAGYYIAGALKTQVQDILRALNVYYSFDVEINRIGIEPNQLSPELVRQNKYQPKEANLDKWMRLTGGINGERKGLELDALTQSEIADIFIAEMRPFIDGELYKEFVKEAYIKRRVLKAIQGKVDRISELVTEEFIDYLELKDMDIFEIAKSSYSISVNDFVEDDYDHRIDEMAVSFISEEL